MVPRVSLRPCCVDRTYAGQLDAAVTALGGSTALLDVKDAELTTGGLDDTSPVGGGVVAANFPPSVSSVFSRHVQRARRCANRRRLSIKSIATFRFGMGRDSPVTTAVGDAGSGHFD